MPRKRYEHRHEAEPRVFVEGRYTWSHDWNGLPAGLSRGCLAALAHLGGAVESLLLVIASGGSPFTSDTLTIVLYVSGIGLLLWVASVSVILGGFGRAVRSLSMGRG